MLERVPLLDKHLDDYEGIVEDGTVERIRELAKPLAGARVLHVNATAYGGVCPSGPKRRTQDFHATYPAWWLVGMTGLPTTAPSAKPVPTTPQKAG